MAVPTTSLSHRRISYSLLASMAALLLVFHHHIPSTTAQPLPWRHCNDTSGNFTDKSAYQANINQLAAALTRNASSSPSLFATGAVGSAPDVAYALALCRGDTNASSCARCVAASFKTAQQLCAFKRGATLYDDPCILRYADWDFLANTTDNRGLYIAWSYDNISAASAPAFDASSGRGRILYATSDYAATDPIRRFGTGEEDFDDVTYPKVYTLAQCTPDMTEAECRKCLGGVYARFAPMYFAGKHGGRVFGVRCSFRFETYPFFSGNPLLQIPGPPRNMTPPPPVNMTPPPPVNMTLTVTGQDKSRNKTTTVLLATLMPSVAAALGITMICFSTRTRSAAQSFQPCPIGN